MEYNSSREHLLMPEYGRNIQKMVHYAMGVEDREERNKLARTIVNVMGQLNPQLRELTDFKHKLWDHLFFISEFKLDVDSLIQNPMPAPTRSSLVRYLIPGRRCATGTMEGSWRMPSSKWSRWMKDRPRINGSSIWPTS